MSRLGGGRRLSHSGIEVTVFNLWPAAAVWAASNLADGAFDKLFAPKTSIKNNWRNSSLYFLQMEVYYKMERHKICDKNHYTHLIVLQESGIFSEKLLKKKKKMRSFNQSKKVGISVWLVGN